MKCPATDPIRLAREELAAFLSGYAERDPAALEALVLMGDAISTEACPWRAAAADEIRRRLAVLMGSFSFALLVQLQLGVVDARSVVEAQLADEEAQPVASAEPPMGAAQWQDASLALRQKLGRLAKDVLGVPTLAVRNWDSLDFHSVGVGSLRDCLLLAYLAGQRRQQ